MRCVIKHRCGWALTQMRCCTTWISQVGREQACRLALHTLLVRPELTLPTVTLCRPVIVSLVVGLVDEALRTAEGFGEACGRPASEVATALVNLVALAPHVKRCVNAWVR